MNRITRSVFLFGGSLFALVALGPIPSARAVQVSNVRTVALTGMPAPGAGAGVTFTDLRPSSDSPQVNTLGRTAFTATLSSFEALPNGGEIFDTAVYSEGGGSLSMIAKRRNQPPGTSSGTRYNTLNGIDLNDNGAIAYQSDMNIGNNSGIWSNRTGTNALVVRDGQQAIGYPSGVQYGQIWYQPLINNAGRIVSAGFPRLNNVTTSNVGGLYSDVGGSGFQMIARTGDPAPGLPGTNYDIVGNESYLNNAGQIGFYTTLTGSQTGTAFWTKTPTGPVTLMMRTGTPPPFFPGLTFTQFRYGIDFARPERVVFGGFIAGDAVTFDNDEVLIYSGSGGAKTLIRREGQQAFGLPGGVVFGRFGEKANALYTFRSAHVNVKGDILFRAGLRGTGVNESNNAGIWFGNPTDGFDLVMRTGSQMPGLPAGSNFDLPVDMEVNDLGQFAFLTRTTIWATDKSGSLTLIAREGDQIDVDNGPGVDLRTIHRFYEIAEATNHDSGFMSLSSLGHIAFYAQLTDGTQGLFVSTAVAVPEPGSAALLACALIGITRARIRQRPH